jgi:pimeloyl-ACP methyl ester carboxylesterase
VTPTDAAVANRLDEAIAKYGLADALTAGGPVDEKETFIPNSKRRRRGFNPQDYDGLATLSLVREDGILRWDYLPAYERVSLRRRARRAGTAIGGETLRAFSFKETPPNQVIEALETLDKKLTPNQGLRIIRNGKLETLKASDKNALRRRVLLLVHGTFSKSDMYLEEFKAIAQHNDFLGKAAGGKYDAILAFDHPTLAVSPWINALDLEEALAGITCPIDVVCHSRGGLVVAWWLRNAQRNVGKVVFAGSPLVGTSLASPAHLRGALDMMANVAKALEIAGGFATTVLPFMAAVTGLARIVGGILQFGANTPLADAAVAIVPGLAAQSRVSNNAELDRLTRAPWISTPVFHAVRSNFEPAANDSVWQFWKRFRNLPTELMDRGADLIFQGQNDLVVDTASMTQVCGTAITSLCDFKTSSSVHHVNYFRQKETVDFLESKLL